MNWYTADEHLWHEAMFYMPGILRPQRTSKRLEHALIQNNNRYVGLDDTVYHIGDVFWFGPDQWRLLQRMLQKMNGRHVLILGNHDRLDPFMYMQCGFESVHTSLRLNGRLLVHDPSSACIDLSVRVLCGHVHTHWWQCRNAINVGIDVNHFTPISEEMIDGVDQMPEMWIGMRTCRPWNVALPEQEVPHTVDPNERREQ